ncbi:hypothetical protein J3R83DRAFT_9301 [Lanmaoa asiatica]|nr:hypothetical protein J3R83DRAFT_9301 [Lanmaoa asiatica]
MPSSTVSASSHWSISTSRMRPSQPLSHAYRIPPAGIAQAWSPIHVPPSYQHSFQDARPYWPCIHLYFSSCHPFQSRDQQHPPSRSALVLASNACPQCWRFPKLPDHRFCSIACGRFAARSAPELKYLPPRHKLSIKIATQFMKCWKSVPRPKVLAVYMVTWTESSQSRFEQYSRDAVEARGQFRRIGLSPGNEQKRFRSTVRACTLGERGNLFPCHNEACWMCETIRCGFEPHLERKRSIPWDGCGIRLGAGIYTSHTSSKADNYAENIHDPNSSIKAMLVCRVVVGNPYVMYQEDQTIRSPPPGYDCVFGKPGWESAFAEDEYVVYNADAVRAAYLVLYEKARGA